MFNLNLVLQLKIQNTAKSHGKEVCKTNGKWSHHTMI